MARSNKKFLAKKNSEIAMKKQNKNQFEKNRFLRYRDRLLSSSAIYLTYATQRAAVLRRCTSFDKIVFNYGHKSIGSSNFYCSCPSHCQFYKQFYS